MAATVVTGATLGSFTVQVGLARQSAAVSVCDLVDAHYFKSASGEVREWAENCRRRAQRLPLLASRADAIGAINEQLSLLDVSHLFLYTPDENRALWDQEARDTGLRARNIDGDYILFEVLEGSPGARAGFKPGDELRSVDGYDISGAAEIAGTSGTYRLVRAGKPLELSVKAEALAMDLSPRWTPLGNRTHRLRIQSLLARHFDRETWVEMARRLKESEHVILDLRGNAGGSFPAMLRVASAFFCEETRLGTIYQPQNDDAGGEADLADELSADAQLEQLEGVAKLHLRTFSDYPCYDGAVTVLVDADTSSVAEILAESFFDRPLSRVHGMLTAGQVVMAQWFPISGLGAGDFSVSIPIAGYRTRAGFEMEDEGVIPEKQLLYDAARARQGRDSWLEDAAADAKF